MTLFRIADAARLAVGDGAPGDAGWTGDDTPTAALMDVSADATAAALRRLRTLGLRLAGRLALHEGFRVLVSTGATPPADAAEAFAEGLALARAAVPVASGPRIAALVGEDLAPRVEELAAIGAELRAGGAGERLMEQPLPIVAGWSETTAAPVRAALSAGAVVVFTRGATMSTLAAAAAGDAWNEPIERAQGRVASTLSLGRDRGGAVFLAPPDAPRFADDAKGDPARPAGSARAVFALRGPFACEVSPRFAAAWAEVAPASPGVAASEAPGGCAGLTLWSADRAALAEALRLVELWAPSAAAGGALESAIAFELRWWPTSVPRTALEELGPIGFDARPAAEWSAP